MTLKINKNEDENNKKRDNLKKKQKNDLNIKSTFIGCDIIVN
jgi:hypothetical protein